MVDTLIVKENGIIKIKKYDSENDVNLDDYSVINNCEVMLEINHEKLCECKVNDFMYNFMKDISYDDIFNYLQQEFNYTF